MRRQLSHLVLSAAMLAAASVALAKAPTSKGGMQPVDTAAGSFTDSRNLLQVDLDRQITLDVSGQPLEVAFNQVSAVLGIEWGFAADVNKDAPVTVMTSGAARQVLKALGKAGNVRFEAGGPTQIRVVKARSATPAKKRTLPPPGKHP